MYYGWATLGGNEWINNNRAAAYANIGISAGCTCGDLEASLGHELYNTPADDPAPWYDPNTPASRDFHGIVGLGITGTGTTTSTSSWSELVDDGAVSGAQRRTSREIEFQVMLLAATEAGLSYGLEWMATLLRGSECRRGCVGDTLCLYAACPAPEPHPDDDPCDPDPDNRPEPPPFDPVEAGDRVQRQLFDVAFLEADAPEVKRVSGAWTATVTVTLKAGKPGIFHKPVTVVDSRDDQLNTPWRDTVQGWSPYWTPECPPLPDCGTTNPYCGNNAPWGPVAFPGSDPRYPIWVDPCYPVDPITVQRAIYSDHGARVPRVPDHLDKVPLIEVYTGSRPLHRVTIRFYNNPSRRPARPESLDTCEICNEITVPYVPAWTRVTFDGRTKRVDIECDVDEATGRQRGYAGPSDLVLYGPYGQLLDWPAFPCGQPLLIEMVCKAGTLADDARYRLDWVARGDAS